MIEPFAEFAKLGHGIPTLFHVQNRKTAHVHWGDGSLWHYIEFSTALGKNDMQRDLHETFERHAKEGGISKRTAGLLVPSAPKRTSGLRSQHDFLGKDRSRYRMRGRACPRPASVTGSGRWQLHQSQASVTGRITMR